MRSLVRAVRAVSTSCGVTVLPSPGSLLDGRSVGEQDCGSARTNRTASRYRDPEVSPVTLTDHTAAPPAPPPAFRWSRAHVVTLTVVCFAQLLEAIDITVVNVALPTIRTDLHF